MRQIGVEILIFLKAGATTDINLTAFFPVEAESIPLGFGLAIVEPDEKTGYVKKKLELGT